MFFRMMTPLHAKLPISQPIGRRAVLARACIVPAVLVIITVFAGGIFAQSDVTTARNSPFKVGERLSYSVSFENIKDVAFLETSVVSRGKLSGKYVVEVHGKLKTFHLVSAAFSLIDETRTVYADPESGLPLFVDRNQFDGVLPKRTTNDYLTTPTTNYDLLTAFYMIRSNGGIGSFPIFEDGETSILTAQTGKAQKIKTEMGEFDTNVSTVSGAYFDSRGVKELTVYFGTDDAHLPLLITFKTARGNYRVELTSVENVVPAVEPSPTPTPSKTPIPVQTPKPVATPAPYVENQPLLPELSFALGETSEYSVTFGGKPVATLRMAAAERSLFKSRDALRLSATVTGIDQGNTIFALGDSVMTYVVPETLAPIESRIKFTGPLARLTQTAIFDPRTGAIAFGGASSVEAPIGTHTILSLIYAMRSFNLRPSKDPGNPVNDTRVAVFWNDRPYIFTLRPSNPSDISVRGEKVGAQLITINTSNAELDKLAIKVWLSTDERRIPLRFSVGGYQADLTSVTNILTDR